MQSRRIAPIVSLWILLAIVLTSLPVALSAPGSPAGSPGDQVRPMPPHPKKLAEWQERGDPLPPFVSDPDFFRNTGINQTTRQPSQISGSINSLAVVVDFSDNTGTVTASFFDSLIFAPPVAGRGSVRDYYDEVSYGQVDIVTVDLPSSLGWVQAPQPYGYYTAGGAWGMGAYPNNCQRLAEDIVDAVNNVVDFSDYDNDGDGFMEPIMLIHAGPGAEFTGLLSDIWSHSWTLASPRTYDGVTIGDYVIMPEYWQTFSTASSDMTIGVFAHEMGHGFWNLPDLYDVDYSSNGVGTWSLMGYGSWNGPNSGGWGSDGSSPAWPDAWSRLKMGFDSYYMGLNTGALLMTPAESLPGSILRLKSSSSTPQEYFLLENRQQLSGGYDQYLPGSGLLIWHVDEAMWSLYGGPDNNAECLSWPTFPHCFGTCMGSHFLVALEQADGNDNLEYAANFGDTGDPFPGSASNPQWQWFGHSGTNPESGSWYDINCNTDSCLDVLNIMPSGAFDVQLSLQQTYCNQFDADLGDAPDSTNNHGLPMTAYPPIGPLLPVQARFPTVYGGPPAVPGPRHHFTMMNTWLGPATTGEWQADNPPDQDPMTNITPPMDIADQDSMATGIGDDGLAVPVPLADCGQFSLPYHVQLNSVSAAPYYVNAWLDMNRDGDWADTLTCPDGTQVPEWIVQDQVPILAPGITPQITPPFIVRTTIFEDMPFESWLRLSIAELPAPAPFDGRGPAMGYDLGETEDYYLHLLPDLQKVSNFVTPPAPGERVTFTIMIYGLGNVVAQGAVISDTLPPGLDYVSSSPPGSHDPSLRTVTWMTDVVPDVPQKIEVVADVSASSCTVMTNTATLLWAGDVWRRAPFSFGAGCEADDPTAGFTWSPPACVDHPLQFRDSSRGTAPLSYSWDLDGDGLPDSSAADPTWQYNMTGTYTVSLTTTNACGCTDTYTDTVQIGSDCIFPVYLPIVLRNFP